MQCRRIFIQICRSLRIICAGNPTVTDAGRYPLDAY